MYLWLILKGNVTTEALVIAVVGYVVVFVSLVLLFWCFTNIPKLIYMKGRKGKKGSRKEDADEAPGNAISGETTAAISLALHLYLSEFHDEESGVLTIKKVSKSYSPWSSKIYAVRNQFNRR